MLMYDNGEKVCLVCVCERQGKKEGKKNAVAHKHKRACACADGYPRAHAHTYWGGSRTPFLQSNFGGDEMGDELWREGWG